VSNSELFDKSYIFALKGKLPSGCTTHCTSTNHNMINVFQGNKPFWLGD
jgi:hypothetical protein